MAREYTKATKTHSLSVADSLAVLGHDLKNPLGAIFGYADVLLDTALGQGLSEKQREVLHRIRTTAKRSIDLVKNCMFLAETENAATRSLIRGQADLVAVTKMVIEDLWRDQSGFANIIQQLPADPVLVGVERVSLERVCANLIGNALKYTPADGQITVAVKAQHNGGLLEVHNSPAYIPAEEQPHLFDLHWRGKKAARIAGSGLGLYIVKSIIDVIDGTIELHSSEVDGTTLKVYLPS